MKKSLVVVVSLIAAFTLFTGCDAILEEFYPEFKGENAFGDKEIKVEVELSLEFSAGSKNIVIAVVPIVQDDQGNPKIDFEGIWIQSRWDPEAFFIQSFSPIKEGAYRVFVFYDVNDDGQPGWDEPSTEGSYIPAGRLEEKFLVDLRDTSETTISVQAYLSSRDRMDVKFLEAFAPDTQAADYSVRLEGPDAINKNAPPAFQYFINRNDPDNTEAITEVKWGLEKLDRSAISVTDATASPTPGAQLEFFVNFGSASPALSTITDNAIYVWTEVKYGNGEMWFTELRVNLTTADYGFAIQGPETLDKNAPHKVSYFVVPNDPNMTITEIWWEIYTPHYDPVDFSITSPNTITAPTLDPFDNKYKWMIDIDFASFNPAPLTNYPYDEMFIEVEVEYGDANSTIWFEGRRIQFASEATVDTYNLDIDIMDLNYAPVGLTTGDLANATYLVEIWSGDWMTMRNSKTGKLGTGFGVIAEFGGLTYYGAGSATGNDQAWVEIDVDGDGWGDWYAMRPLVLTAGQDFLRIELRSFDFNPY